MLVYIKIVLCVDNSHYRGGLHREFRTFVHCVNQNHLRHALEVRRRPISSDTCATTDRTLKGGCRNQKLHSTALRSILGATGCRKNATEGVKRNVLRVLCGVGFSQPISVKTSKKCCKIGQKRVLLPKKRGL